MITTAESRTTYRTRSASTRSKPKKRSTSKKTTKRSTSKKTTKRSTKISTSKKTTRKPKRIIPWSLFVQAFDIARGDKARDHFKTSMQMAPDYWKSGHKESFMDVIAKSTTVASAKTKALKYVKRNINFHSSGKKGALHGNIRRVRVKKEPGMKRPKGKTSMLSPTNRRRIKVKEEPDSSDDEWAN